MDIITDNDSYLMSDPVLETKAVSTRVRDGQHASEPTAAGERPALSLRVRCELRRRLAYGSEVRETKIRELQESIRNGTYHVTAEQIADKMLHSILRLDTAT